MLKKLKKYWLALLTEYLALGYCIEPIQTNPNNQYWNDKEVALNNFGFNPR